MVRYILALSVSLAALGAAASTMAHDQGGAAVTSDSYLAGESSERSQQVTEQSAYSEGAVQEMDRSDDRGEATAGEINARGETSSGERRLESQAYVSQAYESESYQMQSADWGAQSGHYRGGSFHHATDSRGFLSWVGKTEAAYGRAGGERMGCPIIRGDRVLYCRFIPFEPVVHDAAIQIDDAFFAEEGSVGPAFIGGGGGGGGGFVAAGASASANASASAFASASVSVSGRFRGHGGGWGGHKSGGCGCSHR